MTELNRDAVAKALECWDVGAGWTRVLAHEVMRAWFHAEPSISVREVRDLLVRFDEDLSLFYEHVKARCDELDPPRKPVTREEIRDAIDSLREMHGKDSLTAAMLERILADGVEVGDG